jgi:hypothetical protein
MEIGGHDANDLAADTFDFDGATDDGRIRAELLLPERMTENDEIVLAGLVVAGIKGSSEQGTNAEDTEKFCGNERRSKTQGIAVTIEVVLVAFGVGGDVERLNLVAESNESTLGIGAGDADEILRLGERQRAKKNVVDEAEDGSVGADAQSQSEGRDQSESGRFSEDTAGVAKVLGESFEEREGALVADGFLGLLEATELKKGLAAGFVGRKAATNVVVDVELEVRGEFGVEFAFEPGAAEKVAEPVGERTKNGHDQALLWATKRRIEQFVWESNRKRKTGAATLRANAARRHRQHTAEERR